VASYPPLPYEFLLKFARDSRRYHHGLLEATKRFCLSVLPYMVTANHLHLLARDSGERVVIPKLRAPGISSFLPGHFGARK
jgi:hypothetical protein